MCSIDVSAADRFGGIRERMEDHPILAAASAFGGGCQKLLSQLVTDARHTPLQRVWNDTMAYLMLKPGIRTIEVSWARIEHLHELVPGEKWRLWVHGMVALAWFHRTASQTQESHSLTRDNQ